MAHEKQLKNPKYRTWVKAGLGLKYLKEGLEQFTVDVMDEQHQAILMTVRKASKSLSSHCNQCQINTLMPNHIRTKSNHCPLGAYDCNCRQPRGKRTCPNDICSAIYDQIIQLHSSTPPAPYWRNTDAILWCSNAWEIAKCFINAPGYSHTMSAHGTDCAGLLHIIVNNLGFRSHLKCVITGMDIFSKTRQFRNQILHSACMELEDQIANDYIDDMIAVLQDPKELCSRQESINAVRKLIELKNKDFLITTENEMEIVHEMRNTLTKVTDESVEKIRLCALEKITEMELKKISINNEIIQSKTVAIEEIQASQDNCLNKHTTDLETWTIELKKDIEETVKAQENRITKGITAATKDFNLLKSAAVKEFEVIQTDLFSKHLIELDKKVEKINIHLSAKVKANDKTDPKQEQAVKSVSKPNMSSAAGHIEEGENEQEKTCFTDATTQPQITSNYDIGKQEFKKRLICLYLESIVKDSVLPLHPEMNKATIDELYVTPWMKLEENKCKALKTKTAHDAATRNEQGRSIQSFYDIFYKDDEQLKLIYIVGDAGSGKSAFCKNMIYKWCLSHSAEKKKHFVISQRKNMTVEELSDDEVMTSYEFLFYISLRHNPDTGDIKTMLNNHYDDPLLDAVLERESEKCLILIDGLDEWKPPAKLSQTQTNGLPERDLNKIYTVITTSRPWKFEVLKIKDSEIDSKIRLCGIEYKSVIKMATYIVSHLNSYFGKKKSVNRFLAKYVLSNVQKKTILSDIVSSPVMLKQLVCLWFEDKLCRSLRCQIYCSMLELSLEWSVQRKPEDEVFEIFREQSLDLKEVTLPRAFDEDSICEEYNVFVSRAGKIAYQTLFSEQKETSLTFSRLALRKYGATKDFIQCCLEMGILTEEQNITFSLTKRRNTQLSFTHKSIQEILAAIYIVIECQTLENNTDENEAMHQVLTCFKNVKSVEDVLEQSHVIELVCGLDPALASYVSRYIYDIVVKDKRFIVYRKTLANWYDCNILLQIQELSFGCIKEFESTKSIKGDNLYLADVIIRQKSDIPLLKNIKTCNVLSVTIAGEIWGLSRSSINLGESDVEQLCYVVQNCSPSLRRFSKIDSITADADEELPIYDALISSTYCQLEVLELRYIRLSHDNMCRLSTLIEKNITLEELALKEIYCDDDTCITHDIGLSGHKVLRNIDINSTDFQLHEVNVHNLKNCSLTEMKHHINIGHLFNGALVLEYLSLSSCTFVLDDQKPMTFMPKLKHIDLFDIQMSETTWQLFIIFLRTCPHVESLSLSSVRLPDQVKLSLLTDLQEVNQIESLKFKNMNISLQFPSELSNVKNLVFDNMECFQSRTCDFIESLQYLCNLEHISFQNMNIQNSNLLPQCNLMYLKHILLENIKIEKEAWFEFGNSLQKLDNLETLEFKSLNIPDNALKFTINMQHLNTIIFEKVFISLDSWKEIAYDLSLLPQTVEVQTVDLCIEKGSLETAIDYVKKRNDSFRVTLSFGVDCTYKTIQSKC